MVTLTLPTAFVWLILALTAIGLVLDVIKIVLEWRLKRSRSNDWIVAKGSGECSAQDHAENWQR